MPSDRPFCLCLAGANGSGKSTLAAGLQADFSLEYWIDPDQIARSIADRRLEASISEAVSREAFRQARNTRCAYAAHLQNFGFETVFSHGSNLGFLKALKTVGYEVHLYYVSTDDVEINVARVRNRVLRGGHDVPENKVRDRYADSILLLSLAVRECDRVVLYDNSRRLQVVGPSEMAGRLAGEVRNDLSRWPRRQISLLQPIPTWMLTYAVSPFAVSWATTDIAKLAREKFANEIHFTPGMDLDTLEGRQGSFKQFTF